MDELAKTKPAATRNAQIFVSDINRTPVTGDEKAVILNYILSNVDFSDVSDGYKEILRKQI